MFLRFMRRAVVIVMALYLLAAGTMFGVQRNLQYFPSHADPAPDMAGLTGVTVERLPTPDGETITLWYAPAPATDAPTLLFFHGNAGEIGNRANRFAAYQNAGFGVAFLSYRGFGGSTGSPSEQGLLTDARTAHDWLVAEGVEPAMIAVIGESLGTGVAVQLAATRTVGAVILEAPYSAAVAIAADQYPWLPVRFLMRDQFRSIEHIGDIQAPILIQHGTEDRVIPYASGRALFEGAPQPATFITVAGAGHGALFDGTLWPDQVAFLREVFAD